MNRGYVTTIILLASCGGRPTPEQVAGSYLVTSHVGSQCAVDQPVSQPVGRLEITAIEGRLDVTRCYPPGGCNDTISLTEETDDGWTGARADSTYFEQDGFCDLIYKVLELSADGDGHVTADVTTYRSTMRTSDCSDEVAVMRGTTMPCDMHERIVGVAIPDAP